MKHRLKKQTLLIIFWSITSCIVWLQPNYTYAQLEPIGGIYLGSDKEIYSINFGFQYLGPIGKIPEDLITREQLHLGFELRYNEHFALINKFNVGYGHVNSSIIKQSQVDFMYSLGFRTYFGRDLFFFDISGLMLLSSNLGDFWIINDKKTTYAFGLGISASLGVNFRINEIMKFQISLDSVNSINFAKANPYSTIGTTITLQITLT